MSMSTNAQSFSCPHCHHGVVTSHAMAGAVVACGACGRSMQIPAARVDELVSETNFGRVYRDRLEVLGETVYLNSIESVSIDTQTTRPNKNSCDVATVFGCVFAGVLLLLAISFFDEPTIAKGLLAAIIAASAIGCFWIGLHPSSNVIKKEYRVHLLLTSGGSECSRGKTR